MTRTQRRLVRPVGTFAVGITVTLGLTLLGLTLPFRYGMDASAYLAVFTVGLLATLAGTGLATPKRRRT